MHPRPSALWNPAQLRAIDSFAIRELSIPGYELMHRAAGAALKAMQEYWPHARRIGVLCGGGNNGGDGYVFARLARAAGFEVDVAPLIEPERLSGDAHRACRDWVAAGGGLLPWPALLAKVFDVLVDGVLGIGASRGLEGEFADAVEEINARAGSVLSLDVPSGLDAQHGKVLSAKTSSGRRLCVRADLTVTFIADKPGLWLADGPDFAGKVRTDALGLKQWPDDLGAPAIEALRAQDFDHALAPRARGANKGRFGHVLVVGGHEGMPGATLLCAEAALRSGAGLVSVATAAAHASVLAAARPELMIHGVANAQDAKALFERSTVIAIGPGLGSDDWSRGLWSAALATRKPLVVDADALNLLAQSPQRRADWILTPHPGEAGRLLGSNASAVQADRIAALEHLRERFGGTIVLKGAGTLIGHDSGPTICTRGNPGMAAPGMGDALTGIIAALYAQIGEASTAARAGVFVHATAGDLAARAGERGMITSDLIANLRACLNP